MRPARERGQSLIETLLAVFIGLRITGVVLYALAQLLGVFRLQEARDLEQSTIGQLTDHLTTEEDDAWAIYVPPKDVLGNANDDGHEVDFFARNGKQQPFFWAYTYDAGTHTVRRYRLSAPDAPATLDRSYEGIFKFTAHTYPLTALQDKSSPIYSPLYDRAHLHDGIVHFYPNMPWIAGGNPITYVQFSGATLERDLELVTATAPSGFTVVLSYTPSPAPSASSPPKNQPQVWPAAIAFAAPQMTLPSSTKGSGCTSVAYADSAMTQRLPPQAANPYTGQTAVDSNGCYTASGSSAYFTVHEDDYTDAFNDSGLSCPSAVTPGGWTQPSGLQSPDGPTSSQLLTARGPTDICTVTFGDARNQSTIAYAAVLFPNPMYALVNATDTVWAYECYDKTPKGHCYNGGWEASLSGSSIEYVSTDQGQTWARLADCSVSSSCTHKPQFTDTETSCTQEKAGGPCGAGSRSSNEWSPYPPPNAP